MTLLALTAILVAIDKMSQNGKLKGSGYDEEMLLPCRR